jgi:nucleoside-diphosphate-sugar epimerase
MKTVVAGGTGFVGRYIAAALLAGGHEVTVLGRDPARAAKIPQLEGARAIRGDVTEPATLSGALDGTEVVVGAVQLPNYPIEVPRKGLTFDRYDRHGTENLIAAAERAGVGRFVYVSGAGADAASDKTWYREGARRGFVAGELSRMGHRAPLVGLRAGRPGPQQVRSDRPVLARGAAHRGRPSAHPTRLRRRDRHGGRAHRRR